MSQGSTFKPFKQFNRYAPFKPVSDKRSSPRLLELCGFLDLRDFQKGTSPMARGKRTARRYEMIVDRNRSRLGGGFC